MLAREEADNLLDESKNELVEMLCNMSDQIDMLNDKLTDKDEEIERLKADKECAKDVINWHEKECKQYIKPHHTKARSIVAMLFWVFAKNRRLHKTNKYFSQDAVTESYFCFQQAYKMLKAQQ